MFAAIVTGRPELAVAVAPVALVALAGTVLAEVPELAATLDVEADRVLEGSPVRGRVRMETSLPSGRIDVVVPLAGPLVLNDPGEGVAAWTSWGGGHERMLGLEGTATRWGLVRAGPVWVRAHGPLGLVRWQGAIGVPVTVRVLPSAVHLRTLLPHPDPRAAAGAHLARRPGEGIEFADARPYRPGDRLRSVNWPLSSRRHELWVNERRPERAADLVVLVDTFADDPSGGSLGLARAARAAWLLAQAHLAVHDRVGLVTFGGYTAWVTPASGDRARYQLLDRLLATTPAWTEAQRSSRILPRRVVPPGASLVAVSPLHDPRILDALVDLRHRGLAVSVVRVDVGDLLPHRPGAAWEAARRIFALELERRSRVLDGAGVPVVAWPAGEDAAAVLHSLRLASRAPARRLVGT